MLEKVEGTILNETVETFSEGLVMEECAVDFALEEMVESIICAIVNTSRRDFPEYCAGCKTLKFHLRSALKRVSWLSKRKRELGENIGKVSIKMSPCHEAHVEVQKLIFHFIVRLITSLKMEGTTLLQMSTVVW